MRLVSRSRHFQPLVEGLSSRLLLDASAAVATVAAQVVTTDDSGDASGPVDADGPSPMDPVVLTWASPPVDDGPSPMDPVVLTWASGPDTVIVYVGNGQVAASGPSN